MLQPPFLSNGCHPTPPRPGLQLADTDLHQIIRSPQPLSDDHVQFFLYQVGRLAGRTIG